MPRLALPFAPFVLLVCVGASASITEIRKDFSIARRICLLLQSWRLLRAMPATLMAAYESTKSCAIVPLLRWTDENGVARSQQGNIGVEGNSCVVSLVANIRVQA